ncbi:holo-ACP synthase [Ruminococcaceae bacterium OttesenSCG-928-A16]|nr:holo-ACP synthase [Ruminococcaceae bacterium OttesenSCG-928-A16]
MTVGIGVDCTQIERIEKSMQKPQFVQRVFAKEEQQLLASLGAKHAAETAAGCFAAKEAFLKAAGVGLGGFALTDIAVLRQQSGKPYYQLSGTAAAYCRQNKIMPMVSLTHEGGLAIAFAVFEAKE